MTKRITLEDFAKLDLRVALVKQAERIENTKKLVKLVLDVGEETRVVVAGFADKIAPESLMDKHVVLLANLEPKKIRGVESQGMILAAEDSSGNVYLVTVEGEPPPGSKVR